ncbi:hypothetical protein MSAN_00900000 [Mycena sanguinolenta]|uniref:Uncharacterized protein n=1 Tax=Mycena sanguinolenta TaxID=230812 RepID=A0A8H7DCD0_9AGAR|nr:hypothetical protein MSAN_00900000 [Mycena sanguinolenta]
MQSPSYLANENPLDALCHHFSLARALFPPNTPLHPTFDMQVIAPVSRSPTHALALLPVDNNPNIPPLMVPVDAYLYHQSFGNVDLLPQVAPSHPPLAPHPVPGSQSLAITLPVVPVKTDRNLASRILLPPEAIGEFPNALEMSSVMSRLPESQFEWYFRYNQGLWKNILALAPRNTAFVELVQMTYKVVADARRMRLRRR